MALPFIEVFSLMTLTHIECICNILIYNTEYIISPIKKRGGEWRKKES